MIRKIIEEIKNNKLKNAFGNQYEEIVKFIKTIGLNNSDNYISGQVILAFPQFSNKVLEIKKLIKQLKKGVVSAYKR